MKNTKNRFKMNDQIAQYRYDQVIRKGTVVKGPIRVDNVDHYHVKWNWEHAEHGVPAAFKQDVELVCDLTTTKYKYELI